MSLAILSNFQGLVVDDLVCVNDGDVAIFFVCYDLLVNASEYNTKHPNDTPVYVDLGSYKGAWASMIRCLVGGIPTIHAFEPAMDHYSEIERRFAKDSSFILHKNAVSDFEGEHTLIYTGGGGHLVAETDCVVKETRTEVVSTKRYDIQEKIHIMKVDIDGGEARLLPTLFPRFEAGDFHALICEWTITEWATTKEDATRMARDILGKMVGLFPYVYGLSRNRAPFLVRIVAADVDGWVADHYDRKLSTDVLFSHQAIKQMTTVPFSPGSWYA